MKTDLLIKNSNIITMDANLSNARWIAVKNGIIQAIGSDSGDMPDALSVIDLDGKTLLPGFIDSHMHGSLTGELLSSVNVAGIENADDILQMIKDHYSKNPDLKMITANSFSVAGLNGKPSPMRWQLDEISKDKPVIIYDRSLHGCIMNTRAMELAGLTSGMPGVQEIAGKVTGSILDDVSYYSGTQNIMKGLDEDTVRRYMMTVNNEAVKNGITSVHSLDGGDYVVDAEIWIRNNGLTDVHVVNYWETTDFNKVLPYGLPRIGGCICLDGSRTLWTMALMEPYADRAETRGMLYYKDDYVYSFIKTANKHNMQCSMHATGDRAIDQYIYLLKRAIMEDGQKNLRHRIEHFSMPTDKHIEIAAELGLALPMQPAFTKVWDEGDTTLYKSRFGKERAANVENYAKLLKAGCHISGGSDSPVTMMDAIYGIDACVNNPDNRKNISMVDALRIFTINGAWAAHEENERGSLEVGKYADMVVLSGDPRDDPQHVMDIKVNMTFTEGKLVYQS